MAKARPIPGLTGDDTYGAAAAKILTVRTQELADHRERVLAVDEIERVHAMRVASRRLRAALEVFEPCFPGEDHAQVLSDVKALADALGERRDRDVMIEALENFAESLSAPDRRGVSSLVETLRFEQSQANEDLEPFVDQPRIDDLCRRLRKLAREAEKAGVAERQPPARTAEQAEPEAPALAHAAAGNGDGSSS